MTPRRVFYSILSLQREHDRLCGHLRATEAAMAENKRFRDEQIALLKQLTGQEVFVSEGKMYTLNFSQLVSQDFADMDQGLDHER